jgi:hypothetical protein
MVIASILCAPEIGAWRIEVSFGPYLSSAALGILDTFSKSPSVLYYFVLPFLFGFACLIPVVTQATICFNRYILY